MKSMNLFGGNDKPKETINQLPSAPIQNEDGVLTFAIKGTIYSLNVNSEEERERVKTEVNANSLAKYDWFKEETGAHHWVLYDTEMYEVINGIGKYKCLHYKESGGLVPVTPLNATSCYCMFFFCESLTTLDFSNFDTTNINLMSCMFFGCSSLTVINFNNFYTFNVTKMKSMFARCTSLSELDISTFDTSSVFDTQYMFYECDKLANIYISNKWSIKNVRYSKDMFYGCYSLPNFNSNHVGIEMAKQSNTGGYLKSNEDPYLRELLPMSYIEGFGNPYNEEIPADNFVRIDYPTQFIEEAIRLAKKIGIIEAAKELKIPAILLKHWGEGYGANLEDSINAFGNAFEYYFKYSESYEERAVRLAKNVGIVEAARRLNIPAELIGRWITKAKMEEDERTRKKLEKQKEKIITIPKPEYKSETLVTTKQEDKSETLTTTKPEYEPGLLFY